ncbi:MAG TPA: hypothetical protein VFB65_24230 [Pyrinomonadaceae bacterium]|nr:hypothetical protein [Pyrinomonadaceae bacterium]
MAYIHHTRCVDIADYSSMNEFVNAFLQSLLSMGIGALLLIAIGMPWCIPFVLTVGGAMWIIAYCNWWLYGRLICLGGDQTCIGMLVSVEPPGNKTFPDSLDTDFSINLLLATNPPKVDQATAEVSIPYGFLMKEQAATIVLPFDGYRATDLTGKKSAVLHAEFEGSGVKIMLDGAQIGLWLAVASVAMCVAIPLPWGPIVAGILALLAWLAMLLGLVMGLNDEGNPADVDPSLATLHTNDPQTGEGADLLGVTGTWVYDTAHEGWNEIHPIKLCEKIGTWQGNWPPDIDEIIEHWDTAVKDATSPQTQLEQTNPQQDWVVHPDVDGCGPLG